MSTPGLLPYLAVDDALAAIALYTEVFGAKERYRLPMGDAIAHAELDIGDARILLSSEFPQIDVVGPKQLGGTSVSLLLYVEDVDAVVGRALAAGFTQEGETKNEFFGDRAAKLVDPFGHRWMLNQVLEVLEPEEIVRRFEAVMNGQG